MRLFIAREAVDHHFALAFPIVNPESTMRERLAGVRKSAPFYATWYPSRWLGALRPAVYAEFGKLARHLRFADRATNKLGRALFHAMVRHGPKLERRQMILFRAVDIGAELYAMAAACVRARMLAKKGQMEAERLADVFCREARVRVRRSFAALDGRNDTAHYRLAQEVLRGEHTWLEAGIMAPPSSLDQEHAESDGALEPNVVMR
jgi:hypothetical protein